MLFTQWTLSKLFSVFPICNFFTEIATLIRFLRCGISSEQILSILLIFGGVKNTNTAKDAFLCSHFCCPQKLISWVNKNHVGLKKQTNTKQKGYFESRGQNFGPSWFVWSDMEFFFNWTAFNLGVWNSDPCFKWMETCKNWVMIYKSRGPKFEPLPYVNEKKLKCTVEKLAKDWQVQGSKIRTLSLCEWKHWVKIYRWKIN